MAGSRAIPRDAQPSSDAPEHSSRHPGVAERSTTIRSELKAWEREFAAANGGQKPGKDDVKRNPGIDLKYKEYNRLRGILSGKINPDLPVARGKETPRKRKHDAEPARGLSKRQHVDTTPSKPVEPWMIDQYESPSVVRSLFTPTKKTVIDPTPQKDGQVLGLFDLLQEDPTPSKAGEFKIPQQSAIHATPSKPRATGKTSGTPKHSRTPRSTSRQYLLDTFATPIKNRQPNAQGDKTPSNTVSKLSFSTPSFLRRESQRFPMATVNENEDGPPLSPQMVRVPRKPLVRGLSSMLAGLRKMEDDAADEDLEALREMEAEMAGTSKPALAKPKPTGPPKPTEDILVRDSQPGLPLGGFDDEALYDSEPEEPTLGRDGLPLKTYKKKGQKRTTRRVKMRPSRAKPTSEPNALAGSEEDDSEDELHQDPDASTVRETQIDPATGFEDARNFDSDTQSEYTASEGGTRYKRPDQSKKQKRIGRDGKIKRVARKVNALAHQNFKRLKLRNSGAKGGPGHGSRFRRKK
ncbi:hypothetical protein BP6252_02501 [Coleophoma cylindrospora]|uniref:DNA replication regulator SLD2 n=1 Tax=Coleophoma cylindrospora TaxID=1849047 RepID=A0A3D8SFD9_9HELO|nr:hypothetical protein BP6252_02501 [Coleophoma cylindrospora]